MPSIVSEATENKNDSPEDIFSYNHDRFYEFIEKKYSADLAQLFSFQAIRNGTHLLSTSCDEILMIFQQESDNINQSKKMCCFQTANNKYEIKLSVKLAIKNFIQLLTIKQEQQKKKMQSSTKHSSSNCNTTISTEQTQLQIEPLLPVSTSVTPSASDISSTRSRLPPIQKKLNEIDHKADIEEQINK
ncbi:unnamed protein product [Rotaria sordida]|uniref:Uncharacterized protein n=1 Tax=Rotaria sordida TaxID=392033 RepID=A0A819VSG3_9BILA|nr:unnamed protein product [Rotaria sordida]CAF4113632.1 unnamed protein product [Rotaria sordida]